MNLCDSCETVSHCTAHGCIPLTECINSGQVSAAQVVAHQEAGELIAINTTDRALVRESVAYGWRTECLKAEAALAAERAEVARLRELLSDALNFMEGMDPDESFNPPTARWAKALTTDLRAALTAPGENHD